MSSSHSASCSYHFGSVTTQTLNLLNKGSVTQGTAITSGVTLASPLGKIRTVNSTLVTGGSISFVASYPNISTNSIVFASVAGYSGNAGHPSILVNSITSGSCIFTLQNSHKDSALNGAVTIAYNIM